MIISHKHKFISIDPPKTGTNYRQNLLWNYGEFIEDLQHANLIEVKNFFQDYDLEDYFVFTFVRNPWYRYNLLILSPVFLFLRQDQLTLDCMHREN